MDIQLHKITVKLDQKKIIIIIIFIIIIIKRGDENEHQGLEKINLMTGHFYLLVCIGKTVECFIDINKTSCMIANNFIMIIIVTIYSKYNQFRGWSCPLSRPVPSPPLMRPGCYLSHDLDHRSQAPLLPVPCFTWGGLEGGMEFEQRVYFFSLSLSFFLHFFNFLFTSIQ